MTNYHRHHHHPTIIIVIIVIIVVVVMDGDDEKIAVQWEYSSPVREYQPRLLHHSSASTNLYHGVGGTVRTQVASVTTNDL